MTIESIDLEQKTRTHLRILERVQTDRGPADGGTWGTKAIRGQRGRDLVAAVLEGGAGRRSGWDQPRAARRRPRWLLTQTQPEASGAQLPWGGEAGGGGY